MARTKKFNLLTIRDWALFLAEVADAWRFAPRTSISAYAYLLWYVVEWFMKLPNPTTQQTTLVSIIAGLAAVIFAFYVNTGRKWNNQPDYCCQQTLSQPSTMDKDAALKMVNDKLEALNTKIASKVMEKTPVDRVPEEEEPK